MFIKIADIMLRSQPFKTLMLLPGARVETSLALQSAQHFHPGERKSLKRRTEAITDALSEVNESMYV
jgi:hypothetical protein